MIELAAILTTLTVFGYFLPAWSQPGLFFAVTVEPAFCLTAAARRILALYRTILWISLAVSLIAAFATGREESIFIQLAGFLAAVAIARKSTLPYATSPDATVEVNLAAPPESFPGGLLGALLPLVTLAGIASWASRNWEQIPERFPVHWGIHGADRWVARTPREVYGTLGAHAVLAAAFLLIAAGIVYWSRRASAAAAQDRRYRSINAHMFVAFAWFPVVQAWATLVYPAFAGLWVAAAVLAAASICYFFLIRDRPRTPARATDHTPDSCWKLGMFYYNPSDPAVFVLRRFGLGYSLNFGNRWNWAGVAVLLAAISARALLS